MTFYCLVFLSSIFPLPSISAHVSLGNEELSFVTMVGKKQDWQVETNVVDIEHQKQLVPSVQRTESEVTTGLRPGKGQGNWSHGHHLKNVCIITEYINIFFDTLK